MYTKADFKEALYNSLFNVTELVLETLRHYIPQIYEQSNQTEKIFFIDSIKRATHKQKKRAQREVDENRYPDFIKFFEGVHKENVRQICLRIRLEMFNIQKERTEKEILENVELIKDYLTGSIDVEINMIRELHESL